MYDAPHGPIACGSLVRSREAGWPTFLACLCVSHGFSQGSADYLLAFSQRNEAVMLQEHSKLAIFRDIAPSPCIVWNGARVNW